jgi:CRISPR-associated protein Cas5t
MRSAVACPPTLGWPYERLLMTGLAAQNPSSPPASARAGVGLFISAPIAAFRVPQAREYLESFPCPPPATVYGALLSLVGETARLAHAGAELAIAQLSHPSRSVVLRTLWRVKALHTSPGTNENKRPDFQELLSDIRLAVWVRTGHAETASPSLAERVVAALRNPRAVTRFGGLALGESTHLVDELRPLRKDDGDTATFLVPAADGPLALPLWPDHVGSTRTRWVQCRQVERHLLAVPAGDCWVAVAP